jgi:hypothetical protein
MASKKVTEIPTIDVVRVTVKADGSTDEIVLDTASKIALTPQVETTDAVKLIIKGVLKAQKPQQSTVTGNTIVLTDNVFSPELVKILQGGTIKYWTTADKSAEGDTDAGFGVSSYTPPVIGDTTQLPVFTTSAYSAQYNAAGQIVQYEKIEYPNCQGTPTSFNSEDGVFRTPEYTINSMPDTGEAPYKISYMATLPAIV